MKRIFIGIPSGGEWKADFGLCLANMCMATLKHGDKEVTVCSSRGSMLGKQRHELVMEARKWGATHLFFLDSDMVFPEDTLDQLLFWEKPLVGGNYSTKTIPGMPTTRKWTGSRWEFVFTDQNSEDLEEVHRLPTGVMLIEMGVFEKLQQPWFSFPWCGEEDTYQGEDWTFCERVEAAGIPMYVDHNVSQELGHVGNFTFKNKHIRKNLLATKEGGFRTWESRGLAWQG